MTTDFWSGKRIPLILNAGPVNSGKTLFLLTIDQNCRKSAAEIAPTTIVWDQEGSAEPYVGGLNFEWKDTRAAVNAGVHREKTQSSPDDPRWLRILKEQADCNDSPSASMFRAWYLSLLKVPAGKYAVGGVDTWTPLEAGAVDWLRRHPEAFGRTTAEYQKASSMFLWPDLKNMLAHILTIDCRLRFQTFVLNVHLKNEWSGNSKTGRQIAEGLDILEKLVTLSLELDRSPKEKGKEAPRVPSAIVKKQRLVNFSPDGNDLPILPPRIPQCTPDAIRDYIVTPPDFTKLKLEERMPDQSMTDDDKLRLQATISENNRVAEESHLSALEMARRAMEHGGGAYTPAVEMADAAMARNNIQPPVEQAQVASAPVAPALITEFETKQLLAVLKELFATGADACEWLTMEFGVSNPAALTKDQGADAMIQATRMLADKQLAAANAKAPKPDPTAGNTGAPGSVTAEQRDNIKSLLVHIYGEANTIAMRDQYLKEIGVGAFPGLSYAQAQRWENQLKAMPQAENWVPF